MPNIPLKGILIFATVSKQLTRISSEDSTQTNAPCQLIIVNTITLQTKILIGDVVFSEQISGH